MTISEKRRVEWPIMTLISSGGGAVLLSFILFQIAPGAAAAGGRNSSGPNFDLRRTCAGWEVGFADYRAFQETAYELTRACNHAPTNLNRGLFIAGSNRSDDLFMFIKHPIYGLKPRTTYRVSARVKFLSTAPTGCLGIGGDPGANVYVKFGAAPEEPSPVIEADGMVRMNVDIGNQSNSGADAVVIGNIATSITNCHNEEYEAKSLKTRVPLLARSDESGTLWVFVGTDSGFEGRTSLIYTKVQVRIQKYRQRPAPSDQQ